LLTGLQKHGVTFVGKDRVENFTPSEDGQITTKNGKVINADLVVSIIWLSLLLCDPVHLTQFQFLSQITTIGGTPNTGFIAESLGADVLSASKHVRVLPTLQLPNHSNIFALGDIIDWQEQRQAAKIPAHAGVVAKNVLSLLNDRAATAEYKGSPEITIVTLGPVRTNIPACFLRHGPDSRSFLCRPTVSPTWAFGGASFSAVGSPL
jgi:hypothetical protein